MTGERIVANLLLDGFYALSLCVSAMFFIATQRATSARWSAGLRRIPEAFMCALPVFVLLMIPLMALEGPRTALFSWTLGRSQNIGDSSGTGWFWYAVVLGVLGVRASYKVRDEMRKATPKLELRQRRLRELLASLDARE